MDNYYKRLSSKLLNKLSRALVYIHSVLLSIGCLLESFEQLNTHLHICIVPGAYKLLGAVGSFITVDFVLLIANYIIMYVCVCVCVYMCMYLCCV